MHDMWYVGTHIARDFYAALEGTDGERVVIVDSRGRVRHQAERESAQPGRALKLTLDLELQQIAAR